MIRVALPLAILLGIGPAQAAARLTEPHMSLHTAPHQQPHVALTLDACSGKTDDRILSALVENHIPATVFVSARWLKRNEAALQLMLAHPDLFQIENHGRRHVPAVDVPGKVYGIAAAGSPQAVTEEVTQGAAAVKAATGRAPEWFRGATARYNSGGLQEIAATGEAVAGYSLRADDGAALSASGVRKRLAGAKDGDVIIAHVNHPEKPAGAALVAGIVELKAKGFLFVKLGSPPKSPVPHPGS